MCGKIEVQNKLHRTYRTLTVHYSESNTAKNSKREEISWLPVPLAVTELSPKEQVEQHDGYALLPDTNSEGRCSTLSFVQVTDIELVFFPFSS